MPLPANRDPKKVGGSDVAAICSESDFSTPIQVWCRLTGREVPGYADSEPQDWGRRLEGAILQSLSDDLQVEFDRGIVINHPDKPYCISPDGLAKNFYAEVKNLAWWKRSKYGSDGSGEVETGYLMQCQHGLGILRASGINVDCCHFRALFGGQRRSDFKIWYDQEFVDLIWNIVDDFLEKYVKTDTPPGQGEDATSINVAKAYAAYLANEYKIPSADAVEKVYVESDEESDDRIAEFYRVQQEIKRKELDVLNIKNLLIEKIGLKYGIQSQHGKFLWYPVAGRVKDTAVIAELAEMYDIPDDAIAEIRDRNRGEEYRVPKFYPSKEFKEKEF